MNNYKISMSSREAVTRDLRIFISAGTANEREKIRRSRIRSRTKTLRDRLLRDDRSLYDNSNSGFTLIELLVVVLIIGILAAVALPQYRLAVAKSRFIEVKNIVDKITQAQEVYYLANGKYSSRFEELDIDLPAGGQQDSVSKNEYNYGWGICFTGSTGTTDRTACYNSKIGLGYMRTRSGTRYCIVLTSDTTDWKNQICKQETGKENGTLSEGHLLRTY